MDVGQSPHAVRHVLLEADTDTDADTAARIAPVLIGTVTEPTVCVKASRFGEPLIVEAVRPRTQYSGRLAPLRMRDCSAQVEAMSWPYSFATNGCPRGLPNLIWASAARGAR
ncbi:hypothetical protein ME763_13200 [Streptomyces murinus]|uniref:hypothetical protein n=1 Tax=Streptomyces murinus TaxID=33900 RepID=UPI00117EF70A|nr:hypothetical protein [Streptomyces murinus]WDO06552.1 hypothetical protein ME763_13200 [Streptomyces murinus]